VNFESRPTDTAGTTLTFNNTLLRQVVDESSVVALTEAHFSVLWDCINVCDAVADDQGMLMERVDHFYLALLEPIPCPRLELVYDINGDVGRKASVPDP
jgi:hypothetical protein